MHSAISETNSVAIDSNHSFAESARLRNTLSESTQQPLLPWVHSPFDAVRIAVAALLLVAAGLKTHQLATSPLPETDLLTSRWFLIAVVECELALGFWLLSAWQVKIARFVAIGCFTLFGIVTLFKAFQGAESCGCFGKVSISPWYTVVVDFLAVAALLVFKPSCSVCRSPGSRHASRHGFVITSIALLVVGIPAGWAMATFSPNQLDDEGLLNGSGQIVVLEPEQWIGKPFPLKRHIDQGEQLGRGSWNVVLYHHDCPNCQKLIAEIQNDGHVPASNTNHQKTMLVEMPPYGPDYQDVSEDVARVSYARLSDQREWFVSAPAQIQLAEGTVIRVSD